MSIKNTITRLTNRKNAVNYLNIVKQCRDTYPFLHSLLGKYSKYESSCFDLEHSLNNFISNNNLNPFTKGV